MLSRGAGAGPSGEPLFPKSPVDEGTAATTVDVDDVIPLEEVEVVADAVGGCFFFLDLFFFFLEAREELVAPATSVAVKKIIGDYMYVIQY